MTDFRCAACSRDLAGDTAFCPYCGADRRPRARPEPPLAATPALETPAVSPEPPAEASPSPPLDPAPPHTPAAAVPASPAPKAKRGCLPPLLITLALVLVLTGVSWCALRGAPTRGAPPVAGAIAAQTLHVSRRWRTVRLPGDAPAAARFAVSSDTALRVRVAGRIYAVKPGRPLRLPDDVGDSIDIRAADYVAADDAAKAKAALSTLRGG